MQNEPHRIVAKTGEVNSKDLTSLSDKLQYAITVFVLAK